MPHIERCVEQLSSEYFDRSHPARLHTHQYLLHESAFRLDIAWFPLAKDCDMLQDPPSNRSRSPSSDNGKPRAAEQNRICVPLPEVLILSLLPDLTPSSRLDRIAEYKAADTRLERVY